MCAHVVVVSFLSVQSSCHEFYGWVLSFSIRQSAITDGRYPFSLWAVSLFDGKLPVCWLFCVTLPKVRPTFQQRVHWHSATYPAVEALIPFLSPTRLSFCLLWLSPRKIVNILFLLWANMKRKHIFWYFHTGEYSFFVVCILFLPLYLMARAHACTRLLCWGAILSSNHC